MHKSQILYLRFRIEELITPHKWSCPSELCMNFVFAYCLMISTNPVAYFNRNAVFKDDESHFVDIFSCHLGHVVLLLGSKGQIIWNTFSHMKLTFDWSI